MREIEILAYGMVLEFQSFKKHKGQVPNAHFLRRIKHHLLL
jgi:hypothetical protein